MAVPILIDEIFRGNFADCAEPLWTPRAHPDEIAGSHRIPGVAQAINAAAFKHQQTMFHHMHFDHAQGSSRLINHRVHCEIKTHGIGEQVFNLQARVTIERFGEDRIFTGN